MSQATEVKLCQLFLQTTFNMTHQSINYRKYGLFCSHWKKASESPINTVEMKRLEKNFKHSHNFKFACHMHTKRQNSYFKKQSIH